MTDLKKLLIDFDTLTQKNRGLSLSKQIDLLESTISRKFSVTLIGGDSSVDNDKVEQLHSDEELMSKIEDMSLNLAETSLCQKIFSAKVKQTFAFEYFQQQLKDLFKTHRNTVSTAVNHKDDLVADKELRSKISNVIQSVKDLTRTNGFGISSFDYADEIIKIFKTHQNTAHKSSTDKIVCDDELKSKFKKLMNNKIDIKFHQTGDSLGDYSGYNYLSGVDEFLEELVKIFKNSSECY